MTESSNVNKSLENQIENMIDGIIGEDNEESSLHFSEEEEETAKRSCGRHIIYGYGCRRKKSQKGTETTSKGIFVPMDNGCGMPD